MKVSMESWRSWGSQKLFWSPKLYSFSSCASSLATCSTGETLRDSTKASAELSVESTIWDIRLLLGYVKQTASPYSSMMSCLTALFDTVPAELSFSLSLMEVRLYADLLKSSSRAKNLALKESSAAVTESSISRFFIISSILA